MGVSPEVASYARELAAASNMELQLLAVIAKDKILLDQKDEALRHQAILNRECNHRLLNNLQMIVSLLSLQSGNETSPEAANGLAVAAKRVGAIARLHRHLHSMDSTPTVQFKNYLVELCRDHSTLAMSKEKPNRDIVVEGVEVSLSTVTGIPLGLIVNELVTNAIKHGEGRITVTLEPHPAKGYALSVSNRGPALPADFDPTACTGLGMTLVASLTDQIGGTLRIDRGDDNDSTRFAVEFAG